MKIINKVAKETEDNIIQSTIPLNAKSNIEKLFFKFLDRHFLTSHKFHKIVRHNTVKISYCCINNMGPIMSSYNKQVLQPHNGNYGCNCRLKESCPLDSICLTPNIIYEAEITNHTIDEHKKYIGAVETLFKERYRNHTRNFKHKKRMKCTKLSKYIWSILAEKFFIIKSLDDSNLLNRISELVSKCRHQNKLLLSNVKRNDSMD